METGRAAACAASPTDSAHREAPPRPLETRSSERTNLFVAAVLYSEGGTSPAKVRNLSECGALVEATVVPPAGTSVRLCRGSLAVIGKVVWCRGGKVGLRFDSKITITDWLPNNVTRHQSRVDAMVHHVKSGGVDPELRGGASDPAAPSTLQQVKTVAASLERLAEELASDPYIIANHDRKLQQIEITVQQLRRIVAQSL